MAEVKNFRVESDPLFWRIFRSKYVKSEATENSGYQ